MFSHLIRGRKARRDYLEHTYDGPIRLDEARLAAWALALGEIRPSGNPPRAPRTHRGMLPDVDLANAVPAPRGPSLLGRVVKAFAGRLTRREPKTASCPALVADGGDTGHAATAGCGAYRTEDNMPAERMSRAA